MVLFIVTTRYALMLWREGGRSSMHGYPPIYFDFHGVDDRCGCKHCKKEKRKKKVCTVEQ